MMLAAMPPIPSTSIVAMHRLLRVASSQSSRSLQRQAGGGSGILSSRCTGIRTHHFQRSAPLCAAAAPGPHERKVWPDEFLGPGFISVKGDADEQENNTYAVAVITPDDAKLPQRT